MTEHSRVAVNPFQWSAGAAVDPLRRLMGHWGRAKSGRMASLLSWWRTGDVPWLRDISIQARFALLIGVAMVAGVLVAGVYMLGEHRITLAIHDQGEFQRLGEQAGNIRAGALAMQTAANGLTAERQRGFIDDFDAQYQQVNTALAAIKGSPEATDHAAEIEGLDKAVAEVAAQFKIVANVTLALGLTEGDGLRGKLRSSVKAIEDELKMWPNTDDLKARMLQLREAEKDFMLYQEESFLGKSRGQALQFDIGIDSAALPNSTKDDFRAMAAKYSANMAAYGSTHLDQQAQIAKLRSMFAALQPKIAAFAALAREGTAEATLRQDETRAQVAAFTALVGSLGYVFFLLTGLISARSIAQPVLAMEKAMNWLANGDNTVEIPGTHRADEVGLMAKAVRVFRDNALAMEELRIRQEAEQAAKELRTQVLDGMIKSFDADVGAIIHTVAGSASEAEATAREMESFVGETVTQMRAVDESSGMATNNVQAMAAAAEQLAYSVAEISSRVNNASQVANRAADAAKRTDTVVRSLFEVTQKIDTVITFIQAIAAQTRLLALNATIEAARAGEHGHGFTVVANEVKQLADQTGKATAEIAGQISAVQAAGREAVAAIREISASVAEVNEISSTIAAAVEEQGAATKEIARSAQEAAQSTTMVASSITWVVNGAAEMQTSAGSMLQASGNLSGQSQVLRAVVDNFLMGVNEGEVTLKWGDSWLTGHTGIDAEHRMLVQYVNDLGSAVTRGEAKAVLSDILGKLTRYTIEHFANEERIFAASNLPSLDGHRAKHAAMVAKVEQFRRDHEAGKETLGMEMLAFLREWLLDHVFKVDKLAVKEIALAAQAAK